LAGGPFGICLTGVEGSDDSYSHLSTVSSNI